MLLGKATLPVIFSPIVHGGLPLGANYILKVYEQTHLEGLLMPD